MNLEGNNMATYYTAILDNNSNITPREWVERYLVRAFDSNYGNTSNEDNFGTLEEIQEQITKFFKSKISEYEELFQYNVKRLSDTNKLTEKQWRIKWRNCYKNRNESVINYNRRIEEVRKRHNEAKEYLFKIYNFKKVSKITKKVAYFGIKQLENADKSLEYITGTKLLLREYKQHIRDDIIDNIKWYKKQIDKHEKLFHETLELYSNLLCDLKSFDVYSRSRSK